MPIVSHGEAASGQQVLGLPNLVTDLNEKVIVRIYLASYAATATVVSTNDEIIIMKKCPT